MKQPIACRRAVFSYPSDSNMIAATRLALKDVNIAATTALQGLDKRGRELGLKAGANILMPIVTLPEHRNDYQRYTTEKPLYRGRLIINRCSRGLRIGGGG